ncbi:MAG: transcription-repair coupling factor, partial [Parvularculaceae bacterium]
MPTVSGTPVIASAEAWSAPGALDVYNAPDGADALAVAEAARLRGGLAIHIARDGARAAAMNEALRFFAPDIPLLDFPAWDCLPYDRVSPSPAVSSARMATLAVLAKQDGKSPLIVTTTVNAVTQRTPPKEVIAAAAFTARPGETVTMERLTAYLAANGYARASTVREAGEFAVRGGLIDIFPPGADDPIRLDFFGDTLESVRAFDSATQLTTRQLQQVDLAAATEILLTEETVSRFRAGFVATFGPASGDPVYEAASAGRKHAGMEHWLPLFYARADSLFDFIGGGLVVLEHLASEAAEERFTAIGDHYNARAEDAAAKRPRSSEFSAPAFRPLKPSALYLSPDEWRARLEAVFLRRLSPFSPPEGKRAFSFGAKVGRSFAAERA